MEKYCNVGDLLKVVNPTLVSAYEHIHLNGTTLESANEEYASVKREPSVAMVANFKLLTFALFLSACWAIVTFFLGKPWYVFCGPSIVIILIDSYRMHFLRKQMRVVERFESVLQDFRRAVEALNPLRLNIQEYNKDSVRNILVALVANILLIEGWFETGFESLLMRRRVELDMTIKCAQKFGLEFEKRELFADAKKYLEQAKQTQAEK